jgi:FtsH-binding integral membrane protein
MGQEKYKAMKALDLSQIHHSLYIWPAAILSAFAVFFFGWAALISNQNWAGQVMWGGLAAVIATVLLVMAIRESNRSGAQHGRSVAARIRVP